MREDSLRGTGKPDVTFGGADQVERVRPGDVVCAGTGDDLVTDVRGVTQVELGEGDDRLYSTDAGEIYAGPGNDRISLPETSAALVALGPGDDHIVVRHPRWKAWADNTPCVSFHGSVSPVQVNLTTGRANRQGSDHLVNVRCVTLSRFDDSAVGTPHDDNIETGPGLDLALTGAGNDGVVGGANADRIYLGSGDDYANGEQGWDRLYGQAGSDTLEGWSDGDYLNGGTGNDQLYAALFCAHGGNSYDTDGLMDDAGNELFGGPGSDYLVGDKGNDRLDGGSGIDYGLGGYRDHRVDWTTSVEHPLEECLTDVDMSAPFHPNP